MRGAKLMRGSVRSAKRDRDIELTPRHREHVRRVIHDLIECDERKAERHKFNDRPQSDHRCANSQPCKAVLADWGINDSTRSKSLKQPMAYLVGTLIFADFLTHQEN